MADQGERVIHDAARRYPIEHLSVIEGIECGGCNAMQRLKTPPSGAQRAKGLLRALGRTHLKNHR